MLKYFSYIFVFVFALGSISALDVVSLDNFEGDIYLLPNHRVQLQILDEFEGDKIIINSIESNIASSYVYDAPYYNIFIEPYNEGNYNIKINYSIQDENKEEVYKVISNYDLVGVDVLTYGSANYRDKSDIRFIVQNNSNSDILIELKDDLKNNYGSYKIDKDSKKVIDGIFIPKFKGIKEVKFKTYIKEVNFDKLINTKKVNINSKYTLKNIFRENTESFMLINPSLNLFSSIRSILSILG